MKYANVIIDISLEKLDRVFQYIIPDNMREELHVGMLVKVPFGRATRRGYVVELLDEARYPEEKLKEIGEIEKKSVTVSGQMIELAWWMKERYGCTMNQALKTVLPVKRQVKARKTGHSIYRSEEFERMVEQQEIVTLNEEQRSVAEALKRALRKKSGPSDSRPDGENRLTDSRSDGEDHLTDLRFDGEDQLTDSRSDGRNQLSDSWFDREDQPSESPPGMKDRSREREGLSDSLESDPFPPNVHLLFGVTGSGKTEVYLDLIEETIRRKKQAIVLIPEISLTMQTILRFRRRLGDAVAVIHSRLSDGERYETFDRAKRGEVSVVVGARSAIFTPFPKLGLIIIDEEHEESYKNEPVPKYHAREIAIQRSEMTGAMVLLGSATPSLESFYRAKSGYYGFHELPHRGGAGELPAVSVVDLREELAKGNRTILSRELEEDMVRALEEKRQIMLFLNRRGYANFVSCRSCGQVISCPHCSVALKPHRDGKLKCHYCGYEATAPKRCPTCGSPYIGRFGTGTQKVEEYIRKRFPQAGVLRMDVDTTAGKEGHEAILKQFRDGEADILIGTQMIVKGHDIKNVTLVGILAADLSLFASDYGAAERTFDLLTQAAGRAGRGEHAGKVVIQTYRPDHYSIVRAATQDYVGFYEDEMAFRRTMHYPPCGQMAAFLVTSADEAEADRLAETVARALKAGAGVPGESRRPDSHPPENGARMCEGEKKFSIRPRETEERNSFSRDTYGVEAENGLNRDTYGTEERNDSNSVSQWRRERNGLNGLLHGAEDKMGENMLTVIGPTEASVAKVKDIFRRVIYIKHDDLHVILHARDVAMRAFDTASKSDGMIQFDLSPGGTV
ncbi:MAG: primosomal protein N' [Lachnospiraceae bacterium]|nr:primosomal protein N' [Lachnospiraceae bacterium]